MLRQFIVDVDRFLENAESRTTVEYAVALACIIVALLTTMVLFERKTSSTV